MSSTDSHEAVPRPQATARTFVAVRGRRIRVLTVTNTRTAALFLSSLDHLPSSCLLVESLEVRNVSEYGHDIDAVALLEFGSNMAHTRSLSGTLRSLCPDLPQIGLVHCTRMLESWHVESLLSGELAGIVDMEAAPEELLSVFSAVLAGTIVLQVRANPQYTRLVWPVVLSEARGSGVRLALDDEALARLSAQGGSEAELGRELHLSPHTIHHKLERVRATLGLRNRIELAAWSGAHGFYPQSHGASDPIGEQAAKAEKAQAMGGSQEAPEETPEETPL